MYTRKIKTIMNNYFNNYKGMPLYLWGGFVTSFIVSLVIGINYFLSLYFTNQYHMSIENVGILISIYGLGTIAGGMFGGRLSDSLHPRNVAVLGLLIQVFGYFSLIYTLSFASLATVLFMNGIGSYSFATANYTWILSCCTTEQRYQALSILDVTSNAGLGLSGVLIGFLTTDDFPKIFGAATAIMILMAAYIYFFRTEKRAISGGDDQSLVANGKFNLKTMIFTLFCVLCAGFMISQDNSTYPIYLRDLFPSMEMNSFGILFSINTFMVVLLQTSVTRLFQDDNKIILAGAGVFLIGAGFILLLVAKLFLIAVLGMIITTIGEMIFFPTVQYICYECGSSKRKGASIGSYRTVYATSRFIGPATGAYIYQHTGGASLWVLCCVMGSVCLVLSIMMWQHLSNSVIQQVDDAASANSHAAA
jgi:predicted MFS family arabinose efflux permease